MKKSIESIGDDDDKEEEEIEMEPEVFNIESTDQYDEFVALSENLNVNTTDASLDEDEYPAGETRLISMKIYINCIDFIV